MRTVAMALILAVVGLGCSKKDDCPSGQVDCGGTCIDPANNPTYCGAGADCAASPGVTCNSLEACVAGTCVTTLAATQDGWSVRCLDWNGNVCVHPQAMMDCTVCATYADCGVWHDVVDFNNGSNRTALNFCAIATGSETVLSVGTGGAAIAPRGCGWSAATHPICTATKATYHAPQVTDTSLGLNLEETYCSNSSVLLTIECAGW